MDTTTPLHPLHSIALRREDTASAFSSASLRGEQLDGLMDPVLMLDHFVMTGPFFAPHPHAGFSVATYLFEDSEGEFSNRDSLGDRSNIAVGGLLWIHTGGGVQHEENPATAGVRTHGLQLWLNVPSAHKHDSPERVKLAPADIPEVRRTGGARVRVLAGEFEGVTAPGTMVTPLRWLDVTVPPRGAIELAAPGASNTFALVIKGDGGFGADEGAEAVAADHAVAFGRVGGTIRARAGGDGLQFLLLSGEPLEEPVTWQGPFVGSSPDDLRLYFERFRSGAMGELPPVE